MKRDKLIKLLIVAVVLGGVAYLTSRKNAAQPPRLMGDLLLPALSINDITAIRMTGSEGTTTLARKEDGWGVESKYAYPANYEKLHAAVVGLADLKIAHGISSTDRQKEDMHITKGSDQVQFLGADSAILGEIILGDVRMQEAPPGAPYGGYPNGRFVSTDGGKSVVVISQTLDAFAGATANSWLDTDLLNVTGTDVVSIRVSGSDREPISFALNPEDQKLSPTDLKQGEALSTNMPITVQDALSYLRLTDVADPALTDEQLGMDDPVVFESMTKNGTLYVVRLGDSPTNSEDRYARISVSYIGTSQSADTPKTEEDEAAQKAREAEIEKTKADAAALSARFASWTYVIPSYKANSMLKRRHDYIKGVVNESAGTTQPEQEPAAATENRVSEGNTASAHEAETTAEDK